MADRSTSETSDLLTALDAVLEAQPGAVQAAVLPPLHDIPEKVQVTFSADRELLLRFMRRWY